MDHPAFPKNKRFGFSPLFHSRGEWVQEPFFDPLRE